MRAKIIVLLTIIFLLFQNFEGHAQHDWTEKIAALKPTVVNIERSSEIVFETEKQGKSYWYGLYYRCRQRYHCHQCACNGYQSIECPVSIFTTGVLPQAKKLYFDPVHDFGFYQLDPQKLEFNLQSVECGSWNDLSMGDELAFLSAITKGRNIPSNSAPWRISISTKASAIPVIFIRPSTVPAVPAAARYGIPRVRWVGIHSRGTRTSDFELPIDYLLDVLHKIKNNLPIKRGEIGVDLKLITMGEAIRHYRLPKENRRRNETLQQRHPESDTDRVSNPALLQREATQAGRYLYISSKKNY